MPANRCTIAKDVYIEFWEKSFRLVIDGQYTNVVYVETPIDDAVLEAIKVVTRHAMRCGRNQVRREYAAILKEEF